MKFSTVFGLTVVAGLLSVVPAQAQSVYNWTGFYAGVEAGAASGRGDGLYLGNNDTGVFVPSGDIFTLPFDVSGGLLGGHAGYMNQMGGLVLGLDGSWDWSSVEGTKFYRPTTPVGKYDLNLTSLGTINAKLGVANGRWLAYATGGFAFGSVNIKSSGDCNFIGAPPGCTYLFKGSAAPIGWNAGAGISYAATNSIIIGAEYLHVDLGSTDVTFTNATDPTDTFYEKVRVRTALDELKARVSFKFGSN